PPALSSSVPEGVARQHDQPERREPDGDPKEEHSLAGLRLRDRMNTLRREHRPGLPAAELIVLPISQHLRRGSARRADLVVLEAPLVARPGLLDLIPAALCHRRRKLLGGAHRPQIQDRHSVRAAWPGGASPGRKHPAVIEYREVWEVLQPRQLE